MGAKTSRIGIVAFTYRFIDFLLVKISLNQLDRLAAYLVFELLDCFPKSRDDLIRRRIPLRLPGLVHLLLSLEVQLPLFQVLPVATFQITRVGPLMLGADAT